MSEIIKVDGLVKRYKELIAVDNFSMSVREGEILGLLGPNGSGKSTTINCILSLLEFDKGNITIMGKEMTPKSYDLKKNIGVVPQEVSVFEELTVYENIDFFCGLYIENKEERKKRVQEAIDFVELNDFKKFRPKKLSGGLKRRLNIACGIAHKPKIIFFDEPTVAVDPQSRNKILEGIEQLRKEGATIIYTSYYMEEVEQIADRIIIIDTGGRGGLPSEQGLCQRAVPRAAGRQGLSGDEAQRADPGIPSNGVRAPGAADPQRDEARPCGQPGLSALGGAQPGAAGQGLRRH